MGVILAITCTSQMKVIPGSLEFYYSYFGRRRRRSGGAEGAGGSGTEYISAPHARVLKRKIWPRIISCSLGGSCSPALPARNPDFAKEGSTFSQFSARARLCQFDLAQKKGRLFGRNLRSGLPGRNAPIRLQRVGRLGSIFSQLFARARL